MKRTKDIRPADPDRIKQTLESHPIPIHEWMLDMGLQQADLLVYAAIFDVLRHEPLTPQHIKQKDVAERIHYTTPAVSLSVKLLEEKKLIFTQGPQKSLLYSLYPFDTLDLK